MILAEIHHSGREPSKCSNDPYSPYRTSSRLSPLQNHHHEHMSCFMQLYNSMIAQVLPFLWPWPLENIKVIKWTQTAEFSRVLHHTKFEKMSVLTQDTVNCIFYKLMLAEFSPLNIVCAHARAHTHTYTHKKTNKNKKQNLAWASNKPTGCGNTLSFIKIDWNFWENGYPGF